MDEIRSSKALEEEIREEARRRADKVLKDAARECEAIEKRGRERLERELSELSDRFARRKESFAAETASRLPLERKRRRLAWVQGRLKAALDECLSSIPPESLSAILRARAASALEAFRGRPLRILWKGLDEAALMKALKPELERLSCPLLSSKEEGAAPGLVLQSEDGSIRFHADLNDLGEELLDARRGELARALLGETEAL